MEQPNQKKTERGRGETNARVIEIQLNSRPRLELEREINEKQVSTSLLGRRLVFLFATFSTFYIPLLFRQFLGKDIKEKEGIVRGLLCSACLPIFAADTFSSSRDSFLPLS
jgi:hypothetical protein